MNRFERISPIYLFAMVAFVFGAILFAFNHDVQFLYDDGLQIVANPNIQSGFDWKLLISDQHRPHRLFQNITLAFDWLISGPKPWAFHLSNDLIHVLCSILFFSLLPKLGLRDRNIQWFAAIIFLIHPLQLEATTYIMGRVDLHRMLTTLVLLHLYLKDNRPKILIYLILVFSLVVKENIALTCVLFVILDLVIQKKTWRQIKWGEHLFYLTHVAWIMFWASFLNFKATSETIGFDLFPFWDYVVSNFHYAWFYLVLILNPLEQALYHDWVARPEISNVLLGIGFLSVLLVGFFYWLRRNPVLSFMIFFFALSYLPNNSFLQFINPFQECRLYQSNAAMAFLLASALFYSLQYLRIKYVVAGVLIVYFLAAHFMIMRMWQQGAPVLWAYSKDKYPASKIPSIVMASHYLEHGQCKKAIEQFETACTNFPHRVFRGRCDGLLGLAYFYSGEREKAAAQFEKLVKYPKSDRTNFYYLDALTLGNRLGKPPGYELIFSEAKKVIPHLTDKEANRAPPKGRPCID